MSLKYAVVGEEQRQDHEEVEGGDPGPDSALNESFELDVQRQKFPEVPTGARQRLRDPSFKPMQVASSAGAGKRDLWKRRCYALFAVGAMIIVVIVIVAIDSAEERIAAEKSDVPTPRTKWSARSAEEMRSWHMLHTRYIVTVEQKKDYDLVLLGDSITESWLGTSYGRPIDRAKGGPAAFATAFPPEDFPAKAAFGISGDQTQHLLYRLKRGELPSNDSTVTWKNVVLLIGVNNLRAGMTAVETYRGIVAVAKEIEANKRVENLFVSLLLPSAAPVFKSILEINDMLRSTKFLQAKTKLIPCAWDVLATGDRLAANKTLMPDVLHPNREGLLKYGACVASTIKGSRG